MDYNDFELVAFWVLSSYDGTLGTLGALGALDQIATLIRTAGTPDRTMAEISALVGAGSVQDDVTAIAIHRSRD